MLLQGFNSKSSGHKPRLPCGCQGLSCFSHHLLSPTMLLSRKLESKAELGFEPSTAVRDVSIITVAPKSPGLTRLCVRVCFGSTLKTSVSRFGKRGSRQKLRSLCQGLTSAGRKRRTDSAFTPPSAAPGPPICRIRRLLPRNTTAFILPPRLTMFLTSFSLKT